MKKSRYTNNKKFSLLGKSFGVISLASNTGISAWYSELCGEGCWPSFQTAWSRQLKGFFFFFTIFGLRGHLLQVRPLKWFHQVTGLWAVFCSFCSKGRLQFGPEVTHCQCCYCQVFRAVVFARQQLHCLIAATLAGQLLCQQDGAIQFCTLPSVPAD
jgi:hypothetical protein